MTSWLRNETDQSAVGADVLPHRRKGMFISVSTHQKQIIFFVSGLSKTPKTDDLGFNAAFGTEVVIGTAKIGDGNGGKRRSWRGRGFGSTGVRGQAPGEGGRGRSAQSSSSSSPSSSTSLFLFSPLAAVESSSEAQTSKREATRRPRLTR